MGKNTKKSHWNRTKTGTPDLKVKRNINQKQLGMVWFKVYLCGSIPNLPASGKIYIQKGEAKQPDVLWVDGMEISI